MPGSHDDSRHSDDEQQSDALTRAFQTSVGRFAPPAPSAPAQIEAARRGLVGEAPVASTLAAAPAVTAARAKPHKKQLWVQSALGLRKFVDPLVRPTVIRPAKHHARCPLKIRARPTIGRLHKDLPPATFWCYDGKLPGPTIEVDAGKTVLIEWINDLQKNGHAAALPFSVVRVPALANAPGPINADFLTAMTPGGFAGETGSGGFPALAGSEGLTAATVVHLHGAMTDAGNDGWAHNVVLPGHSMVFKYPNKQRGATLWYHDHAMAVTRFNVHAGLAGFYLIRDEVERALELPSGDQEIPLMIADRNLEKNPADAFTGRVLYKYAGFNFPNSELDSELPITGPFNVVNGKIWPHLEVEPRWYRFRLLNGAGSRIYRFSLHDTTNEVFPPGVSIGATLPTTPPTPNPAFLQRRINDGIVVIGTEGGLLGAPVTPADGAIEMGPGERMDVLIDFSRFAGRRLELRNELASVLNAQPGQADASIIQFRVGATPVNDPFSLPAVLDPAHHRYVHNSDGTLSVGGETIAQHDHFWVALIPPGAPDHVHPELWELQPLTEGVDPASVDQLIQVTQPDGQIVSLRPAAKLFDDATTIFIPHGRWAVWNFLNLGVVDHPMHIHMTEFQWMSRRRWPGLLFDPANSHNIVKPLPVPTSEPIPDYAQGDKETFLVKANEWVSVLGRFEGANGSFMYHCHILDHEDHTMMRPFVVLPPGILSFHGPHGGHEEH